MAWHHTGIFADIMHTEPYIGSKLFIKDEKKNVSHSFNLQNKIECAAITKQSSSTWV